LKTPTCFIRGCNNRTVKQSENVVRFFSLPKSNARFSKKVNDQTIKGRLAWLKNADQKESDDLRNPRICGAHFHGGIDIFFLKTQMNS
jgi:hypothetical protein